MDIYLLFFLSDFNSLAVTLYAFKYVRLVSLSVSHNQREVTEIFAMVQDTSSGDSHQSRPVRLKEQVQLVKKNDCDRYEIALIQDPLSFEKGFFIVISACQLLAQKNDGIVLVGLAGPSGSGKTVLTEKILNFMPSVAVISMDNYNDSSRIVDGNFDGK